MENETRRIKYKNVVMFIDSDELKLLVRINQRLLTIEGNKVVRDIPFDITIWDKCHTVGYRIVNKVRRPLLAATYTGE